MVKTNYDTFISMQLLLPKADNSAVQKWHISKNKYYILKVRSSNPFSSLPAEITEIGSFEPQFIEIRSFVCYKKVFGRFAGLMNFRIFELYLTFGNHEENWAN